MKFYTLIFGKKSEYCFSNNAPVKYKLITSKILQILMIIICFKCLETIKSITLLKINHFVDKAVNSFSSCHRQCNQALTRPCKGSISANTITSKLSMMDESCWMKCALFDTIYRSEADQTSSAAILVFLVNTLRQ